MKLSTLKKPLLYFILFTLLPFFGLDSAREAFEMPQIETKFLLHTNVSSETSGDFEYYLLTDEGLTGNYAVSLTATAKRSKGSNDVIKVPKTYRGKDVVGIWHNAFHACKAKEVQLHDNIKVIDFEAFLYSGIKKIEIPYTVDQIGDAAFYACKDLVTARFQNNNYGSAGEAIKCVCGDEEETPSEGTVLDTGLTPKQVYIDGKGVEWSTLETIPSFCFFACKSLKEFSPPSNLTDIEWEAFHGCTSLTEVSFYKLRNIRGRAFQGCSSLASVSIPTTLFSLGTIEPYAFNHCGIQIKFFFRGMTETWATSHPDWWKNDEGYAYNTDAFLTVNSGEDPVPTASDWEEAPSGHMSTQGFVIGNYVGEIPPDNDVEGLLIVPEKLENRPVIGLMRGALDRVKDRLRRLYLPKTLLFIDNAFFGDNIDGSGHPQAVFPKLKVISFNGDQCTDYNALRDVVDGKPSGDPKSSNEGNVERRIDLSPMTDLAFIGHRAFRDLKNKDEITRIHLPYRLISVGDQAFSVAGSKNAYKALTSFTWDYREPHGSPSDPDYEPGSRLETVGNDAFWKLGWSGGSDNFQDNPSKRNYHLATLIFPKTFKYFGILSGTANANNYGSAVAINDISRYNTDYRFNYSRPANNKNDRPGHTFTGCPLIKKVIFRGGDSFPTATDTNVEKDTGDLVIPLQAFAFCQSLQTIIIEERVGKTVTFHTQNGDWAQSSCGTNGAGTKSDFRGDAGLQTIILPNRYTSIRFQDLSFLNASRAAMYFSGDLPGTSTRIIGNNNTGKGNGKHWPTMIGKTVPYVQNGAVQNKTDNNDILIGDVNDWCTIGREDVYYSKSADGYYKGYSGYCFYNSITDETKNDKDSYNTFCLDQKIPMYGNVHYKETIKDSAKRDLTVEVGEGHSGDADSPNELVIANKTAFVCDASTGKATATKYLYDLRDAADHTTATIPSNVSANGSPYPVSAIGESCFTACFCEGNDGTGTLGTFDDLTTVEVPNSIESIGDYAFLRAYGVKNFGVPVTVEGKTTYYMPSSLTHIGKNAFTFCNIKEFRKIPDSCTFFENTDNSNYKICSTFSNNYSLRRITFKDGSGNEVASSTNYTTSTYASNDGDSTPFTTSIYSTSSVTYKKSRLLLVLYRDSAVKLSADATGSPVASSTVADGKVTFDGNKTGYQQPFLFGAYRMASWVDNLVVGTATMKNENSGDIYGQPLISGICNRTTLGGNVTDKYIHLREAVNILTSNNKIDLYSFEGDVFSQPAYGYSNCTNLQKVTLSTTSGKTLPNGLFRDANNTSLQYKVSGITPDSKVLDLSTVSYRGIGSQTFKNNLAIEKFIAPSSTSFTIGAGAFEGCTNLEVLDLRNVTSLEIKGNAFEGCTSLKTIIWPSGKLTMKETGAFENCTALKGSLAAAVYDADPTTEPTALTFPANMDTVIGANSFKRCTSLETVNCAAASPHPVTALNASAFQGCTALTNFDFDSFTGLTTIGNYAFARADDTPTCEGGILKPGGVVVLPNHITTINEGAFQKSPITEVTITSSQITLGKNAFAGSSLTGAYFSSGSCDWKPDASWNGGVFSSCASLAALELPADFKVDGTATTSMVNGSNRVEIYLYKKDDYDITMTDKWRNRGATAAPCHFLVEELSDVVSNGNYKMEGTTQTYWKRESPSDPTPTKLGSIVQSGYDIVSDPASGTIIFSEGYQLTSTGFSTIAITPVANAFFMPSFDSILLRSI